jgi:hypothetical protein
MGETDMRLIIIFFQVLFISLLSTNLLYGQFVDILANLQPVGYYSSSAWGDYDNDGDLDILIAGHLPGNSGSATKIYENKGNGIFHPNPTSLPPIYSCCVAWADYDNDGDLDILLSGLAEGEGCSGVGITKIYENIDLENFKEDTENNQMIGVSGGSIDWGDYDNDGDLDIALMGLTKICLPYGDNRKFRIYNNHNDIFVDVNVNIPQFSGSGDRSVKWIDFDNDGDLDISAIGHDILNNQYAKIYKNQLDNNFFDIEANLEQCYQGSIEWGDYNMDGYSDVLIVGATGGYYDSYSKVYENKEIIQTERYFEEIPTSLIAQGGQRPSSAWGDYDNDGDLDIIICGPNRRTPLTKIYQNNYEIISNVFVEIPSGIANIFAGSVSWGDFDNDGDLDILMTGSTNSSATAQLTKIYRNDTSEKNTIPSTPTNLTFSSIGTNANLKWDKSTDTQTVQHGLTYNIRIGTSPGGCEIVTPMSDNMTGNRRIPKFGNVGHNTIWTIKGLKEGITYYWSVQAIDNSFAGSHFAMEQSFTIGKISISIDIKPGSCPNPLNVKSKGVLPVAVLGSSDFNVTEVDFSTIELEGVTPIRCSIEDVSSPANSPNDCIPDGPDGYDDLCLKFDTQEIVNAISPVEDGQEVTLTLTGNLNDGTPIEGKDKVLIIAKGKKLPKLLGQENDSETLPGYCALYQNYPNPFNPETQISYQIPKDNFVSLKIFNSLGQEIRTLVNENQQAGNFSVLWDGRDDFGELVGSGFYFYVLQAGEFRETKKALLLR